jgi:hypothetical protein
MDQPLPTELAGATPAAAPADWSTVVAPAREAASTAFGAGRLIGRTFSIWFRGLVPFGLVGLVCYAPMAVGIYLLYSRMPSAIEPGVAPDLGKFFVGLAGFGVAWVLSILLMAFELGAVSAGALQALRGEKVRLPAMLAQGGRRFLPMLGMTLLLGLAVLAASCALVVPGIILMCGWCAAAPALVAERLGPLRGLGRSWGLTRGRRWPLFAGFLVVTLAVTAAAMAIQSLTMAGVMLATGPAGFAPGPAMALPMAIYQLVAGVLGSVTMVACAVAYHGLRQEKEGGDPVQLARVFE